MIGKCSHCGAEGVAVKRCSRCAQAAYCGAECQKAGWKLHKLSCTASTVTAEAKKTSAPPPSLPLKQVFENLRAAALAGDWGTVLELQDRMEELMANQSDGICEWVLGAFLRGQKLGPTRRSNPSLLAGLEERRITLLQKMQRVPDSVASMVDLGYTLLLAGKRKEAASFFTRAQTLGGAHGHLSLEFRACTGLGQVASMSGRHEEAVQQLRYALAGTSLVQHDAPPASPEEGLARGREADYQVQLLQLFADALLATDRFDELAPLVARYLHLGEAQSRRRGRLSFAMLHGLYTTARLHEARGRPKEAARELLALLTLLHQHRAQLEDDSAPKILQFIPGYSVGVPLPEFLPTILGACHALLVQGSAHLKVLQAETGEQELIEAWAAELVHFREASLKVDEGLKLTPELTSAAGEHPSASPEVDMLD